MGKDIVVMCAGKGSRLMPLTKDIPKCMVEVNGKPILEHIIDNIRLAFHNEMVYLHLIVGYKNDVIKRFLEEKNYLLNTKGLIITEIEQDKLDGTANAINLTKDFITNDEFIVLSGDTIYSALYIKMLSMYGNAILFTETNRRLYEYGTLDLVGKGMFFYVNNINEKSTNPTSNRINCGAYNFDKRVFDYIKNTPYDKRFDEKIITNTINLMIADHIEFKALYVSEFKEVTYKEDIEMLEDYE